MPITPVMVPLALAAGLARRWSRTGGDSPHDESDDDDDDPVGAAAESAAEPPSLALDGGDTAEAASASGRLVALTPNADAAAARPASRGAGPPVATPALALPNEGT